MLQYEARVGLVDLEHGLTIHNRLRNDCEFTTFTSENLFEGDVMLAGFLVVFSDVLDALFHILASLDVGVKHLCGIGGVPKVEIVGSRDSLGFFVAEVDVKVRGTIFMFLFRNDALVDLVL